MRHLHLCHACLSLSSWLCHFCHQPRFTCSSLDFSYSLSVPVLLGAFSPTTPKRTQHLKSYSF